MDKVSLHGVRNTWQILLKKKKDGSHFMQTIYGIRAITQRIPHYSQCSRNLTNGWMLLTDKIGAHL
jgi:hypothetical protein